MKVAIGWPRSCWCYGRKEVEKVYGVAVHWRMGYLLHKVSMYNAKKDQGRLFTMTRIV